MNKIIVRQSKLKLQQEEVYIENILQNVEIEVLENVTCCIANIEKNVNITLNLAENSNSTFEFFLKLDNNNNKIKIINQKNSNLRLHYAAVYKNDNNLEIESDIANSKTNIEIQVRLVENNGSMNVLATGDIKKDTEEITYLEDIKAISVNNEKIRIMPDLLVSSNEVIANHNATISNISESDLFYLRSKGLNKDSATRLIKQGFLKGILCIEELKIGGEQDE